MDSQTYIPSSHEKKKAVLMYLLLGIFMVSIKGEVTEYEIFHIKQAAGRWTLAFLVGVLSAVLLFVPLLKIVPLLIVGAMTILWMVQVYQARNGRFNNTPGAWGILGGIGGWLFDVCDVKFDVRYEQSQSGQGLGQGGQGGVVYDAGQQTMPPQQSVVSENGSDPSQAGQVPQT